MPDGMEIRGVKFMSGTLSMVSLRAIEPVMDSILVHLTQTVRRKVQIRNEILKSIFKVMLWDLNYTFIGLIRRMRNLKVVSIQRFR